jgi:hypothetical protein
VSLVQLQPLPLIKNILNNTHTMTELEHEQAISKLRDEFAMSMSTDLIPVLENVEARREVAEHFGIDYSEYDTISLIEFAFEYQSIMRYMYADSMMRTR